MIFSLVFLNMTLLNKGFTLIELLVTVALLGILTTIAIAQYDQYKRQAYYATMISDASNYIVAQESYYIDNEIYFSGDCFPDSCNLPGFVLSPDSCVQGDNGGVQSYNGFLFHNKVGDRSIDFTSTSYEGYVSDLGNINNRMVWSSTAFGPNLCVSSPFPFY